jgi:transposase-like protein
VVGGGDVRAGRKVNVSEIIGAREGSTVARKRAVLLLRNIAGELTMAEVARELGVAEAMAYRYREQLLDSAIEGLEPKAVGRPAKEQPDGKIEELEGHVKELKRELLAAEIREELRSVVPGIGQKKKRESGSNDRS